MEAETKYNFCILRDSKSVTKHVDMVTSLIKDALQQHHNVTILNSEEYNDTTDKDQVMLSHVILVIITKEFIERMSNKKDVLKALFDNAGSVASNELIKK